MGEKNIRTRYAPSPTGYMHIGNLRTALYEYLIAKNFNGSFIMRLEDTDQERYVEGATEFIYKTLKTANIIHDEGPDIGGDYGPYIQSKRKSIYIKYAEKLVKEEKAYYCFCEKERLAKIREENEKKGIIAGYDRYCLKLDEKEVRSNLEKKIPYVIRQKMPQEGSTSFKDVVFGEIKFENKELDDQILIKADGMPTYNFANVIDDHLMKITHVVRGSEYVSSTPKYNLLYKSFGWEIPQYIHVPLIMKKDGDQIKKFAKRDGDASFNDLIERGFLPQAVVNYIALLGWSPGGEKEIFSMDELIKEFSTKGISKSYAIFDMEKLKWLNGEYLRKMSQEEFYIVSEPYIKEIIKNKAIDIKKVSKILQARTEILSDISKVIDFIEKLPDYSVDIYIHKKMKTNYENSISGLENALDCFKKLDNWEHNSIYEELIKTVKTLGIKNGQLLWPVRTALTGKKVSPGGAIDVAEILGKEESIMRIKFGIDKLKNYIKG
ncbi:MAG: glutamate--tRNA ligase [Clostridiales bacterium]